MRVAFAGTPDFAVPSLNALVSSGVDLITVYTQPDRPAGRGRHLRACPVKIAALERNLAVRQPQNLDDETEFLKIQKVDLLVVVAYGVILKRHTLETPSLGCVNVHASLLPRWRGAAPIQRAIAAGDSQTGISLMQMDEGLDTGPVLSSADLPIHSDDTGQTLHDRLSSLGAELLTRSLNDISTQRLIPVPQPSTGISYAHQLTKAESWIDWSQTVTEIERVVRAFNPWPLTRSCLNGNPLLIREVRAGAPGMHGPRGTIIGVHADRIDVQASDGLLEVTKVQRPGSKALPIASFLNGYTINEGDQFLSGLPSHAHG